MKKIFCLVFAVLLCNWVRGQVPDPDSTYVGGGSGTCPLTQTPEGYNSLFNGGYEKSQFEFQMGYVNKSWRCTYATAGTLREDFWGFPNSYLHGIQVGGLYTPSFDWGLGLRTGLYFEFYNSVSPYVRDYCNNFSEIDLYIPVHASFRIPITNDVSFNVFGGVGFQLAMDGKYFKYTGRTWWTFRRLYREYYTQRQVYGVDGWPHKVNWQGEVGASLRIKIVTLNFTYSWGLNEHGIMNTFDDGLTYETALKSRQDKMEASIAVAF